MPILYGSMEEVHTEKMNKGWIVEQIWEQKLNDLRDSLRFQWSQCVFCNTSTQYNRRYKPKVLYTYKEVCVYF